MPRRSRYDAVLVGLMIAITATPSVSVCTTTAATGCCCCDGETWTRGSSSLPAAGSTIAAPALAAAAAATATVVMSPTIVTAVQSAWEVDDGGPSRNSWVRSDSRRRQSNSNSSRSFTGWSRLDAGGADSAGIFCRTGQLPPLWARVRGGAGTRVDQTLEEEESDEAMEGVAGVAAELEASTTASSSSEERAGQLQSEEAEEKDASDVDEVAGEKKSETKTTTTTAAGPAQSQSVVATLELGKVVPKVIKHAMVFGMGTWVSQKLSPAVAGQVRAARVIYTAYLIFYQGLCMYLRYLIWRSNDDTEMQSPPPPQLMKLIEGVRGGLGKTPGAETGTPAGKATAGGSHTAAGAAGAASSLGPMMEKLLTTKTPAKTYDMTYVQNMRRRQFWASLFMCYTHLRRGMIKPMILQVAFGTLALLDSPLFKIYVLGRKAEGDLARPFKKQGLMDTLSGPMAGLSAKAEEARKMQEAAAANTPAADDDNDDDDSESGGSTTAKSSENGGSSSSKDEDEGDEEEGCMPDIEVLSDGGDYSLDASAEESEE